MSLKKLLVACSAWKTKSQNNQNTHMGSNISILSKKVCFSGTPRKIYLAIANSFINTQTMQVVT